MGCEAKLLVSVLSLTRYWASVVTFHKPWATSRGLAETPISHVWDNENTDSTGRLQRAYGITDLQGLVNVTSFTTLSSYHSADLLKVIVVRGSPFSAKRKLREMMLLTCSCSSDLITTVSGVTHGILGMAGDSTLCAKNIGKSKR